MHNDDLILRQASDSLHYSLKRFLAEPCEENQTKLLTLLRHYIGFGFKITLLPDGVSVSAGGSPPIGQRSPSTTPTRKGGVCA